MGDVCLKIAVKTIPLQKNGRRIKSGVQAVIAALWSAGNVAFIAVNATPFALWGSRPVRAGCAPSAILAAFKKLFF